MFVVHVVFANILKCKMCGSVRMVGVAIFVCLDMCFRNLYSSHPLM